MISSNLTPSIYKVPDLSQLPHHPMIEELSTVISDRTRRKDKAFFRAIVGYYLAQVASCMRAQVRKVNLDTIPVNNYLIALAPSGFGKGYSTFIMENLVTKEFRDTFRDHIMPQKAEGNLYTLAVKRALESGEEESLELDRLTKELNDCGAYPFTFDGASEPAIKQIRQLLLLSGAGSINLQVDEFGLNLEKSIEALRVYLELYDQGMVKPKLTKSGKDSKRTKEIEGKTPSNALLFGTATKLLDAGPVEKTFWAMLQTGYGRRASFAWGHLEEDEEAYDEEDFDGMVNKIYAAQSNASNDVILQKWSTQLAALASFDAFNWTVDMPEEIEKRLLAYQLQCEHRARKMPENDDIRKAEMDHRYYKCMKMAGVFAFMDQSLEMTEEHLYQAIKLTEESGKAFQTLMDRELPYMKLARHLAAVGREVTHADLLEALPFYKSTATARSEIMTMATAWGYRNHIMIKKSFQDGIEFFAGETLRETSLDAIRLSYSEDFADGYEGVEAPFESLHELTQADGLHWSNHWYEHQHREDANIIPDFNMVVLDIDANASLQQVHDLLEDYTFMTYTTKRHTPSENRFRLLLPINYHLSLSQEEYKVFVNGLVGWLPFKVTDDCGNQRSKKWLTCHTGTYHYNKGKGLIDALPFVPKTARNESYKERFKELKSFDALEKWFASRFEEGSRNQNMIRFALALVDAGMTYTEIEHKILRFNRALPNGLAEDELRDSVLKTVGKRLGKHP